LLGLQTDLKCALGARKACSAADHCQKEGFLGLEETFEFSRRARKALEWLDWLARRARKPLPRAR